MAKTIIAVIIPSGAYSKVLPVIKTINGLSPLQDKIETTSLDFVNEFNIKPGCWSEFRETTWSMKTLFEGSEEDNVAWNWIVKQGVYIFVSPASGSLKWKQVNFDEKKGFKGSKKEIATIQSLLFRDVSSKFLNKNNKDAK